MCASFTKFLSILCYIFTVSPIRGLECPVNSFVIMGMTECHQHLTCEDVDKMKIIKRLGTGAVKDVFLVNWNNFSIVLSVPVNPFFVKDFESGVEALKSLSPSDLVVQLLGHCPQSNFLFTEYHPAGNAADFFTKNFVNSETQGLEYCHQYALILNHLHNGPAGQRVFCDSNDLEKLLSQLLITADSRLILNDVDALPQVVNSSGIKCGHKELEGDFVAPEQLWTEYEQFDETLMMGYNEKTDIWKAASVCEFFLKKFPKNGAAIQYRLFDFHKKCKSHDPSSRPSSEDLVKEYQKAIEEFKSHVEF